MKQISMVMLGALFASQLVLGAGCGRIGFDPPDANIDVRPDTPMLDSPFGPPVALTALNGPTEDDDPSMTDDLLEIFFASDRLGGAHIFHAVRSSVGDPWGQVLPLLELDDPMGYNNHPSVSPDGLVIYFSSGRPPHSSNADLYVANRSDRASSWNPPQRIAALADVAGEGDPSIAGDALYFTSTRATGNSDTFVSRRATSADPFQTPVHIPTLSSTSFDSGPWVDASELLCCFASQRGGIPDELYCAHRATVDEEFGPWTPLAELNTSGVDQDPWLSSDLRTIVFASARDGNNDLFIATR